MNPVTVLFASALIVASQARGEEALVSVQLNPTAVVCQKFLGFGAEWDSNGYDENKVTEADFAVIRKRVEWMHLPIARIMMQSRWCYKGNGQYDWNGPKMLALYRQLDVCQKLGTTVLLTDWGIEPSWLATPDVAKVENPKYAGIIAAYMDYLLNKRNYTCIKYFIQGNEPNLEVKEWNRWRKGVENVAAEFQAKGLDGKVVLMGSDQSDGDDWHRNAVDQLQQTLGAYDIHHYATEELVRTGGLFDYYKKNWEYALTWDPKAKNKPLVVGEAGVIGLGCDAGNNPRSGDPRYAVLMSDYAVQAANAGSWAVLAWMLDDNSHAGFTWGMWKNRENGLVTKPWFYTWSLLSRCFPAGATIVRADLTVSDVRVLAANWDNKKIAAEGCWSICIVNRAATPKTVRLQMTGGPTLNLCRYGFSNASAVTDKNGFPLALEKLTCNLRTGVNLSCEANSVIVLSSMGDDIPSFSSTKNISSAGAGGGKMYLGPGASATVPPARRGGHTLSPTLSGALTP